MTGDAMAGGEISLLVSYAYLRKKPHLLDIVHGLVGTGHVSFMLDSGAFTSIRDGNAIDLPEYSAFCREHARDWYGYIQLDEIGQWEKTRRNLDRMLDLGCRPMPVLTVDAPIEAFAEIAEVNRRVCIATGHVESDRKMRARLAAAYRSIGGECDIHGLGYTRRSAMTSCARTFDSSSWVEFERWGVLSEYTPQKGLTRVAKREEIRSGRIPKKTWRWMAKTGMTPEVLMSDEWSKGADSYGQKVTTAAWLAYQAACFRKGKRLYLAMSNRLHVAKLISVMCHVEPNGTVDPAPAAAMHHELRRLDWPDLEGAAREGIARYLKVFGLDIAKRGEST